MDERQTRELRDGAWRMKDGRKGQTADAPARHPHISIRRATGETKTLPLGIHLIHPEMRYSSSLLWSANLVRQGCAFPYPTKRSVSTVAEPQNTKFGNARAGVGCDVPLSSSTVHPPRHGPHRHPHPAHLHAMAPTSPQSRPQQSSGRAWSKSYPNGGGNVMTLNPPGNVPVAEEMCFAGETTLAAGAAMDAR